MSAIEGAKATLLRTLEALEGAEENLGAVPERVDLVVIYSIGHVAEDDGSWEEVGGWSATPGPKWMHAAMLARAAEAFDPGIEAEDD